MTNYIVFFLVILLANIIQGITGFAGTILAMPPSLMLVGYSVAKPVLNVLGLLSGIYVFVGHREHVSWKEVKKIVAVMAVSILLGILIKGLFEGKEQLLYKLLGIFVILLSIQGGLSLRRKGADENAESRSAAQAADSPFSYVILVLAGIVHGIFVSGGPLLISYLTKKNQGQGELSGDHIDGVDISQHAYYARRYPRGLLDRRAFNNTAHLPAVPVRGNVYRQQTVCENESEIFYDPDLYSSVYLGYFPAGEIARRSERENKK